MVEKLKCPYCEADFKNSVKEVPDAARDKCEVLKYRELTKLSVSHPRFYPFFVALPKLGILHFVATSGFARDSRGLP